MPGSSGKKPAGSVGGIAVLFCIAVLAPSGARAGPGGTAHEVKRSETLSGIAHRYGVSVREIVSANRLPGPRVRLQVGRRLTIPEAKSGRVRAVAPRTTSRGRPAARRASLRSPSARDVFALPPPSLLLAIPEFPGPVPEFAWPVDGAVSSNFGRRWRGWHRGIDIVAPAGAPIQAAAAGLVVASGVEPRYGRVVKIEHDHGFLTVYAHNLANSVEVGQRVVAGQEIGNVGQTGQASNPHLHFEIRHEGRVVNPLYLLPLPPRVTTEDAPGEAEDGDE